MNKKDQKTVLDLYKLLPEMTIENIDFILGMLYFGRKTQFKVYYDLELDFFPHLINRKLNIYEEEY